MSREMFLIQEARALLDEYYSNTEPHNSWQSTQYLAIDRDLNELEGAIAKFDKIAYYVKGERVL